MAKKKNLSGWLESNTKRYKTRESLVKAAVRDFGCTISQAQKRLSELVSKGKVSTEFGGKRFKNQLAGITSSRPSRSRSKGKVVRVPTRFKMGVDVSIVKEEYNDDGKINKGIENLGTQIIKDNDFRQELGVPNDRWKVVSGLEKFTKNKIELRGKQFKGVYWGSVEAIKELRKAVDML